MIVTYLRSSSISSFSMCEFQHYLTYTLGIESPPNKAADMGNIVHKGLELVARERLAKQNNEATFTEPETGKVFTVGSINQFIALDHAWLIYNKGGTYTDKDKADCLQHIEKVLFEGFGEWNPGGMDVVQPEQHFDLEIDEPWAKYYYENPWGGPNIEGTLRIKGTVDLLFREPCGVLHYLDWKTGRKWDWAKGIEKNFDLLMRDTQLFLYYYALRRLYPNDVILISIYFVKADGVTTLPYGEEQFQAALEMIREKFEAIRDCDKPKRRIDDCGPRGQPCSFCHFNKTKRVEDGKSLCDFYYGELVSLGMSRTVKKYGSEEKMKTYQGGGGQSSRSV